MKNLQTLNGVIILKRSQQKRIFGGGEQTLGLDGEAKCSNTGCEGKRIGESCVIDGKPGKCDLGTCAGTNQRLCYV